MKRRPIMAGNWKMNMLVSEAEALVKGLKSGLDGTEEVDVLTIDLDQRSVFNVYNEPSGGIYP